MADIVAVGDEAEYEPFDVIGCRDRGQEFDVTQSLSDCRIRCEISHAQRGSEWLGFMVAAITGPWLLHHAGYSITLTMWCVAAPLIAAVAALCMVRVAPQTILEAIHR